MADIDPYKILKVKRNATFDEIKRQYRTLALAHHPDRHTNDNKAEADAAFKAISAAYAILSDPEKRRKYDDTHDEEIESISKKRPRASERDEYFTFAATSTASAKRNTCAKQGKEASNPTPVFSNVPSFASMPPSFKPSFANPSSSTPFDTSAATFWNTDNKLSLQSSLIPITTTLENLFTSTPKTLTYTRITYAVPTRSEIPTATATAPKPQNSYLDHCNQHHNLIPVKTTEKIIVPLHALKHYDGCIITVPGAGDENLPSTSPYPQLSTSSILNGSTNRNKQHPQKFVAPTRTYNNLYLKLSIQPHPTLTRPRTHTSVNGVVVGGGYGADLRGELCITRRQARLGCQGVTFMGIDGRMLDCSTGTVELFDGDEFVVENEGWVKEGGGRGALILTVRVLKGLEDNEDEDDGGDKEIVYSEDDGEDGRLVKDSVPSPSKCGDNVVRDNGEKLSGAALAKRPKKTSEPGTEPSTTQSHNPKAKQRKSYAHSNQTIPTNYKYDPLDDLIIPTKRTKLGIHAVPKPTKNHTTVPKSGRRSVKNKLSASTSSLDQKNQTCDNWDNSTEIDFLDLNYNESLPNSKQRGQQLRATEKAQLQNLALESETEKVNAKTLSSTSPSPILSTASKDDHTPSNTPQGYHKPKRTPSTPKEWWKTVEFTWEIDNGRRSTSCESELARATKPAGAPKRRKSGSDGKRSILSENGLNEG